MVMAFHDTAIVSANNVMNSSYDYNCMALSSVTLEAALSFPWNTPARTSVYSTTAVQAKVFASHTASALILCFHWEWEGFLSNHEATCKPFTFFA